MACTRTRRHNGTFRLCGEIADLYGGRQSSAARRELLVVATSYYARFVLRLSLRGDLLKRARSRHYDESWPLTRWPLTYLTSRRARGLRVSRRKTKRTGRNQNRPRPRGRRRVPCPVFVVALPPPLSLSLSASLLYARHVESRERVLVYLNLRLQKDVMTPRARYANGNALVSRSRAAWDSPSGAFSGSTPRLYFTLPHLASTRSRNRGNRAPAARVLRSRTKARSAVRIGLPDLYD